jgi:hypothetical protein
VDNLTQATIRAVIDTLQKQNALLVEVHSAIEAEYERTHDDEIELELSAQLDELADAKSSIASAIDHLEGLK